MKRSASLLLAFLLTACATPAYLRVPASASGVRVFLENQAEKLLPAPGQSFPITKLDDRDAIESLRAWLVEHKKEISLREPPHLNLKAASVIGTQGRYAVRFTQLIERHEGTAAEWEVPVNGAGVVAMIHDGKLESLNSSLEVPPSVAFVWKNPGFDLSGFNEIELQRFLGYLQSSANLPAVKETFARASRASRVPFDLQAFTRLSLPAQKAALGAFLAKLGPVTTLKAIVELGRKKRLSLVRYGESWFVEVTGFFGIPVQFDLEIPRDDSSRLKLRNFRELRHGVSFNVVSYPKYPDGGGSAFAARAASENDPLDRATSGGVTGGLFQDAVNYFNRHFSWVGYNGHSPGLELNVFKDVTDPKITENAMWHPGFLGDEGHFVIGAGGARLTNFDKSVSTMGHEFAHAITQYTSNLIYRGQSGGLNEHFSDIQGVSLEAETGGHAFDYTIGEDLITPDMARTKAMLIALDLAGQQGLDMEDMKRHNVLVPALRNLYRPRESYFAQPENMAEARSFGFGPDCQPSDTNDHCGVHYLSGVPNRAVSMIIDRLGFERTRNLLFRTNTMRLTMRSDFPEYARQMYQECVAGGELDAASECPVIVESFEKVGVKYPDGSPVPQPPQQPNPEPQPQPQPNPDPVPQSPVLQFCGWISVARTGSGNVTVIDNKFDGAILVSSNYDVKTTGDFRDLYTWRGDPHPCGCVWGRLSQTANSRGTIFNYFLNVTKLRKGNPRDCQRDGLVFR